MRALLLLALATTVPGCRLYPFNQETPQETFAREVLTPAELKPAHDPLARPVERTFRLRVYVDLGYRKQNRLFGDRIRRQVERASQLLTSQFGARVVLESIRPWNRETADSDPLQRDLAELEALDDGEEADWVVGFVAARSYSIDWHQLGVARPGGRHLVLRGMESLAYRQWLHDKLRQLYESDHDRLYEARKLHQETLVLLHEWAHALGVPHDLEPGAIMAPEYDHKAQVFSEASRRVIGRVLPLQGIRTPDARRDWAERLLAELEQQARAFDPASAEMARTWARGVLGTAPAP